VIERNKTEITGLLLSAGTSSRMGENKALLRYNESDFISTILLKMEPVCSELIVVTGYQSEKIKSAIRKDKHLLNFCKKIIFVENKFFSKGMFTSLQAGLTEVNSKYILYHFVDNPTLPEYFYNEFLLNVNEKFNWLQPVYKNKKGHPILFDNLTAKLILSAAETSNLKAVSQSLKIKKFYWNSPYPEILNDIDTKEDFQKIYNHQ
jgi:molybdenum cofactor cytidylyltransferase